MDFYQKFQKRSFTRIFFFLYDFLIFYFAAHQDNYHCNIFKFIITESTQVTYKPETV